MLQQGDKANVKAYVERLLNDITPCICHKFFKYEDVPNSEQLRWTCYTTEHSYHIRASYDHENIRDNYLGCVMSARKPRAGEDWTRGNDLPDGRLNQKTWSAIKHSIIRYELMKLEEPKKAMADKAEEGPSIEPEGENK